MTEPALPETLATTNGHEPETRATAEDRQTIDAATRQGRIAALRAKGWRVELSCGQWATVADPDTITERKVKPIKIAMLESVQVNPDGTQQPNPGATIGGGYVVVAAFMTAWSLPFPLPTPENTDSLLELSARDFSTLSTVATDLREEAFTGSAPVPTNSTN